MDPVIKMAEERLEWLNSDEETQRLYEARENSIIERNSLIVFGEDKGKIEGKVEGMIEGKIEGMIEGKIKGKIEEKNVIALNMLAKRLDVMFISELTGLSVEAIERLKKTSIKLE